MFYSSARIYHYSPMRWPSGAPKSPSSNLTQTEIQHACLANDIWESFHNLPSSLDARHGFPIVLYFPLVSSRHFRLCQRSLWIYCHHHRQAPGGSTSRLKIAILSHLLFQNNAVNKPCLRGLVAGHCER